MRIYPKLCSFEKGAAEMMLTEEEARTKWCPMVRIDGKNRVYNIHTDGFAETELPLRCIGRECMAWREFHLTHSHTTSELVMHGYCGLAGRPAAE